MQIAYLMTHYPRVALTFISGEIDAIENSGIRILPIALNLPTDDDITSIDAVARRQRTHYLKSSSWRLVSATARTFLAHPVLTARLIAMAAGSSQWDVSLLVRRLIHVCYACQTARLCRVNSVHHLHAHFGQTPATIAWFASIILNFSERGRANWSFTIHGFQDFVDDKNARLDLKSSSAAFVACISDYTKSQLCRVSAPEHWNRFHVVRCGIDLEAFAFRAHRSIRQIPCIVTVGRLSPEKGHLILLQALKLLHDEGVVFELQIIGAGPFDKAIRREAVQLGIDGHVGYTGELLPEEVSKRLAEADLFCLPSFSEGLPVSIMEAMAVGVPVVTTWISGIPELAINEVTALTVPAGNSEALAKALKRMFVDKDLRERVVRNARAEVERRHSLTANSEKLVSLFKHWLQWADTFPRKGNGHGPSFPNSSSLTHKTQ